MQETPETAESCAINGVIPPVIMQVVSYQSLKSCAIYPAKIFR